MTAIWRFNALAGQLLLILGLTCSGSTAQGVRAVDIVFVDELHGWVLATEPAPAIFRTSNGGETWIRIPIPFKNGFYRFHFYDQNTGIAIMFESESRTAIYRTEDAGDTWTKVNTIESKHDEHLVDLTLTSSDDALLVGEGTMGRGYVAQLVGRGQTLRVRDDLPADFTQQSNTLGVFHDGTGHVWIVGKELILHSADDGKTWENQYVNTTPRIDMAISGVALPNGYAWILVANFEIYKTQDYGKHWSRALTTSGQGDINFDSISFFTAQSGCAVGNSSFIYCTKDGGSNWTKKNVFGHFQRGGGFSSKLFLFGSGGGWASVNGVLYKTRDEGRSFQRTLTDSDVLEPRAKSPARAASINGPTELTFGGDGFLYIVESMDRRLLRLDVKQQLLEVVLSAPEENDHDQSGYANAIAARGAKELIIADFNGRLRKLDTDSGRITNLIPKGVAKSGLEGADSMAVDESGNLVIADTYHHKIVRWRFDTAALETVASGSLRFPSGVAISGAGDIFVSDYENCRIRKIDHRSKDVTTVAGTGECASNGDGGSAVGAAINYPSSIVVDTRGNLFFVEGATNRVRRVDARGVISTYVGTGENGFSGDGGPAEQAKLNNPSGLALDAQGNLYISEFVNNRIRRVDAATRVITTVAGNGKPARVDVMM